MRTHALLRSAALAALAAAAGSAAATLGGAALAQQNPAAHPGRAVLMDSDGGRIGAAALVPTPSGLLIQLDVEGLPAGAHGFHIHETGECDAPAFKSAGGHFAPDGREHGFLNANGPHAGDLPNVYTEEGATRTRADVFADGLTLDQLLDGDGSAIVIHATVDDYQTDPAGHAGDRLACGVVQRGKAE